jgi:enoyl-CoA hydratase/carnithine racemase
MNEVEISQRAGVLELRLNRPAKKNALTLAMYRSLAQALKSAESDRSARVVLLTAAGDAFCAGNDISDFLAAQGLDVESAPPFQFLRALVGCEKPIVAAVHGAAVGVGATMLLHCDLVYASDGAKLSMPFVNLGLVPEAASSLLLPARVGHAVASEMLLLGTAIDARRAKDLGLVNHVLPSPGELDAFARGKAEELAAKPPRALRTTRKLLWGDRAPVLARLEEEGRHFDESLGSPEAKEAFTAFLERRAPDFTKLG